MHNEHQAISFLKMIKTTYLPFPCGATNNHTLNAAFYLPFYQSVVFPQVNLPILQVGRLCCSDGESRLQRL